MSLRQLVVYDGIDPCMYLPHQQARMPLRLPERRLTGEEFDAALAAGDRRSGYYLYRTSCPNCRACEPIRLKISEFTPNRTGRRVLAKGNQLWRQRIGRPIADAARVDLYNKHRKQRNLGAGETTASSYQQFLVETCCDTWEISYWHENQLAAVSIIDRGSVALSAVYTFFDPALAKMSPGVYAILKQVELCRESNLQYLYLGLYVADNTHMAYKANYLPHERLIHDQWTRFE